MEGGALNDETEEYELETIANVLGQKVIKTDEIVRNLTQSIENLTAGPLNYNSTGHVEGRISVS